MSRQTLYFDTNDKLNLNANIDCALSPTKMCKMSQTPSFSIYLSFSHYNTHWTRMSSCYHEWKNKITKYRCRKNELIHRKLITNDMRSVIRNSAAAGKEETANQKGKQAKKSGAQSHSTHQLNQRQLCQLCVVQHNTR